VSKGVNSALKLGTQAGETIASLTQTLTDTAQATIQIVASLGQQAVGMNQINQAMKNVDQVNKQNLAAFRQLEQAARDLNALASRLATVADKEIGVLCSA